MKKVNVRGISVIILALIFGTVTTITSKAMYQTQSVGLDGEYRNFRKPCFAVWAMFFGMSFSLFAHFSQRKYNTTKIDHLREGFISLDQLSRMRDGLLVPEDNAKVVSFGTYFRCCIPACCDLSATVLSAIGLLYTNASTFTMLRGSSILFTALFTVLFLDRKLTRNQLLGLAIVFPSLVLIGYASSAGSAVSNSEFGVLLITLGQVLQAGQYVIEEKLMKGINVPPLLMLGIEGLFGTLVMLLIGAPLLYWLPGNDYGSLENSLDTFVMLKSSWSLSWICLIYILSIWTFNMSTVQCTRIYSSVVRTLIQQGVRSAFVWILDLILFYAFVSESYGEAWTAYSPLQVIGFMTFMVGMTLYMQAIIVLREPIDDVSYLASPTPNPRT